jgi:hypothetical protein
MINSVAVSPFCPVGNWLSRTAVVSTLSADLPTIPARVALVGREGGDVDEADDVGGLWHGVGDDHLSVGMAAASTGASIWLIALATYAASALTPRSGLTIARTGTPASMRRWVTGAQLPASANAPWTRTTVGPSE